VVVCYLAFSEDNIDKMKGERNETLSLEKYGELSRGEKFSLCKLLLFVEIYKRGL